MFTVRVQDYHKATSTYVRIRNGLKVSLPPNWLTDYVYEDLPDKQIEIWSVKKGDWVEYPLDEAVVDITNNTMSILARVPNRPACNIGLGKDLWHQDVCRHSGIPDAPSTHQLFETCQENETIVKVVLWKADQVRVIFSWLLRHKYPSLACIDGWSYHIRGGFRQGDRLPIPWRIPPYPDGPRRPVPHRHLARQRARSKGLRILGALYLALGAF